MKMVNTDSNEICFHWQLPVIKGQPTLPKLAAYRDKETAARVKVCWRQPYFHWLSRKKGTSKVLQFSSNWHEISEARHSETLQPGLQERWANSVAASWAFWIAQPTLWASMLTDLDSPLLNQQTLKSKPNISWLLRTAGTQSSPPPLQTELPFQHLLQIYFAKKNDIHRMCLNWLLS